MFRLTWKKPTWPAASEFLMTPCSKKLLALETKNTSTSAANQLAS
jgi:hypothetical protein